MEQNAVCDFFMKSAPYGIAGTGSSNMRTLAENNIKTQCIITPRHCYFSHN